MPRAFFLTLAALLALGLTMGGPVQSQEQHESSGSAASRRASGTRLPIVAFPGAEGAGALTPGGRGGRVIAVTTLADRGPGSLRAALERKGPRTIVFRVGGVIELQRPLFVHDPYVTIAGQTAPGSGILLKGTERGGGKMIVIQNTHDVVIRYLRIRSGRHGKPGRGQINIKIDSGSSNIVVDHVSLSWTLDENISIHRNMPDDADPDTWPEIRDVTVQRSLIAEGLWPHSTGVQIGGEAALEGWRGVYDITLHHNLFANSSHRNPGIGATSAKVINNVVYNWSPRAAESWRDMSIDWVGNYFRFGPMSRPGSILIHNSFPKRRPWDRWRPASIYMSNNLADPPPDAPAPYDWALYREHYSDDPIPDSFKRSTPLRKDVVPVTVQPALEAYASVLADVGANARLDCLGQWVPVIDAVDERILAQVKTRTGPTELPPEHPDEVGGYPPMATGTPCADADHDGMADDWERGVGLDPGRNDSHTHLLDPDYTNLEVFLSGMAPATSPPAR